MVHTELHNIIEKLGTGDEPKTCYFLTVVGVDADTLLMHVAHKDID